MAFLFKYTLYFCFNIILMQEGHRNTITCDQITTQSNCECVFLLRRISENQGGVQIKADFSPVQLPMPSEMSNGSRFFSTLPAFNKDQKYYTPSFILQEDQARLHEKNLEILANHQRKVEQFLEQKDELFVPKPSKTNRFCLICKETYEDYLTHISYPSHNRLLRESQFYNDVIQLCLKKNPKNNFKFNKKISKQTTKKEKKTNLKAKSMGRQKSTQTLSTGLQSCQQVQLCVSIK